MAHAVGDSGHVVEHNLLDTQIAGLNATYLQGTLEAWDRIADHADGAIGGVVPNGSQQGVWLPGPVTSKTPIISSGKLQFAAGSAGASYPQIKLKRPCSRIGGRWTFSATGTPGIGEICLVPWNVDIATTMPALVPDTPCHVVVTVTGWSYSYWLGGTIYGVASGTFATPLLADGSTVYTCDVFIDRAKSTATVLLPDGTIQVVTDSHIGSIAGTFACWESYLGLSTDTMPQFTDVWADSGSVASLAFLSRLSIQPIWIYPTLSNNWVNYGSTLQPASYSKATDGTVTVRGLVKLGDFNAAVFNLPAGYRPLADSVWLADCGVGVAELNVRTDGSISVGAYKASGTNAILSLSGISFATRP